ncbi:MAG: TetR/AcrR family transcriptional regulator [Nitrospina sp.]|nr:TetR/AcrR family transcriptional regulator [Nitrospina sp.]
MTTAKKTDNKTLKKPQESIRQVILDKAFLRFGRYGYGKTTMAEIAKDCEMSSGNLYRCFKSKKDICADCGSRILKQRLELVQKTINNKKLNPNEKLKVAVLEVLNYMHYNFSEQPALMELVDFISRERWAIVKEYMEQEKLLISEILFQGKYSGDFNISDVLETSIWIQTALTKFFSPRYMEASKLEELRREADGVVNILIRGLK